MVTIKIEYKGSQVFSISFSGHSGWDEHGKDIVCAAISTLLQTLVIGMEDVLGKAAIHKEIDLQEDTPFARIWIPLPYGDKEEILVDTISRSLKEIARSYPENVEISEVRII
ncbi:MAG TPA: ribosomal-processing cysteine protease Prp [Synergistales bacterium]|nr:ribosomal-processing cysteine protease Prp [Synergistales bacterium]